MKKNDLTKLHSSTKKELTAKLDELSKQYVQEKMNIKLGNQKNTTLTKNIRKDIARIKTILHEQDLAKEQSQKDKKGTK